MNITFFYSDHTGCHHFIHSSSCSLLVDNRLDVTKNSVLFSESGDVHVFSATTLFSPGGFNCCGGQRNQNTQDITDWSEYPCPT